MFKPCQGPNDMNIINEIQNNIKQWNHGLNCLQNQTPTKSTTKIIQLYTNKNHKTPRSRFQQPKLQNMYHWLA